MQGKNNNNQIDFKVSGNIKTHKEFENKKTSEIGILAENRKSKKVDQMYY